MSNLDRQIINDYFGERIGYVIDIGAAEINDDSNSYHLIQRGWKALLVEPVRVYFERLCEQFCGNFNVKICNRVIHQVNKVIKFVYKYSKSYSV